MTINVEAIPIGEDQLRAFSMLEAKHALRFRDEEERALALTGFRRMDVIQNSVQASSEAVVVLVDGELVALWGHGARNMVGGIGAAWFIGTPALNKYKHRLGRQSKLVVAYLMTIYNRLEVIVDVSFLKSIRWLEWLGFEKHPTAFSWNGMPVIFMWKERK